MGGCIATAPVASHSIRYNPAWTIALPVAGIATVLLAGLFPDIPGLVALLSAGLAGSVISAVHHAEVIAHKVGEPFGTLVLALSVTIIEVALIVSMMLSGGEATAALARDTVFAAVMIILNGIIGISLLVGGRRHHEQEFQLQGVSAALGTLTVIVIFTLVLPNYATSVPGPLYSRSQLVFIAVATLVLFVAFTFVQTVRHRDYFLPLDDDSEKDPDQHAAPPSSRDVWLSLAMLLLALAAVVLAAKAISPTIKGLLAHFDAPAATLGILIAAIVLLPEGLAAMRAASNNRLQTSLNLAIGSAIATIGLTIPAVAVFTLAMGWPLVLGLDDKSVMLLLLTLFVASISLRTGRTTVLQGIVHLVLFAAYLFLSFVP